MNHSKFHGGSARFLDPGILSSISNMEILARNVVEGFVSGLHKSPYKGFSSEFLEYRPYIPGDDPMKIDWKVYARSDRTFIKEFEDETNTTCHIMLDISGSMEYSSTEMTKLQYASYLAASLAFFMIRQRDRVGLYLFDNCIRELIPPKSTQGHLHSMLRSLENIPKGAKTSMGKPFHELADAIKKRGIVIIISDMLEDPDAITEGLRHFRFAGNDVIVFHIMDPVEQTLEFNDIVELEDMETSERVIIMSDEAREAYQYNLNKFKARMKNDCGLLRVDYDIFETNKPLDFALFNYLSKRSTRK
ncbi:DUF58 domain-containing protein [Candidatus Latescibacterota bacterium]